MGAEHFQIDEPIRRPNTTSLEEWSMAMNGRGRRLFIAETDQENARLVYQLQHRGNHASASTEGKRAVQCLHTAATRMRKVSGTGSLARAAATAADDGDGARAG